MLSACSRADRTASSCPDWKKWRGLPENLFLLILQEQEEERRGLLTTRSRTVITVRVWSYFTFILIKKHH